MSRIEPFCEGAKTVVYSLSSHIVFSFVDLPLTKKSKPVKQRFTDKLETEGDTLWANHLAIRMLS